MSRDFFNKGKNYFEDKVESVQNSCENLAYNLIFPPAVELC